jgi:hypothetical protein
MADLRVELEMQYKERSRKQYEYMMAYCQLIIPLLPQEIFSLFPPPPVASTSF